MSRLAGTLRVSSSAGPHGCDHGFQMCRAARSASGVIPLSCMLEPTRWKPPCTGFQFPWISTEEFASNKKVRSPDAVFLHLLSPPSFSTVKSESSLSTRRGPSAPSTSRKIPQEKPERLEELTREFSTVGTLVERLPIFKQWSVIMQ